MKLQINEVEFDPASYADPNGRLFHYDGAIYRAVSPEIAPLYASLLEEQRIQRLFDSGLIETEITPLELEGYGLVLRHRKIPFVSYGFEWCGLMLKHAALLVLDLNMKLAEIGFELQDANPWNVLFDGCIPIYVDFGSIVPISTGEDQWNAAGEFIKCFLNPLILFSIGKHHEARERMMDWKKWGVPDADFSEILPFRQLWKHRFHKWLNQSKLNSNRENSVAKLRELVDEIDFRISETEWTDYYKDYVSLDSPGEWTYKQQVAEDMLSRLKPETVLDIGSNTGWFSEMAIKKGSNVVAIDSDESCIQILYSRFARRQEILPLLIDFSEPTPPHGTRREFKSATERIRCDMVFALGLVHHLVFKKQMTFERIAGLLSGFAGKTLLVEFVPKEDRYVMEWYNQEYSWYTLENFIHSLSPSFSTIRVLPSNRPPRSILLCTNQR